MRPLGESKRHHNTWKLVEIHGDDGKSIEIRLCADANFHLGGQRTGPVFFIKSLSALPFPVLGAVCNRSLFCFRCNGEEALLYVKKDIDRIISCLLYTSVYISDDESSLAMKAVMENEAAEPFVSAVQKTRRKNKRGTITVLEYDAVLAVRGHLKTDSFDGELVMAPRDVMMIKKINRMDHAKQKRVELHCHTNMSAMDATIPPDVLITVSYTHLTSRAARRFSSNHIPSSPYIENCRGENTVSPRLLFLRHYLSNSIGITGKTVSGILIREAASEYPERSRQP